MRRYVHSKTWVFDDLYLITGSANCNRRGYSHDSELDVGIYDPDRTFVKDVRVRLWQKRLNTAGVQQPIPPKDLEDFRAATKYWEEPGKYGLELENDLTKIDDPSGQFTEYRHNVDQLAPVQFPDLGDDDAAMQKRLVDMVIDPYPYSLGTGQPPIKGSSLLSVAKRLGATGFFDLIVDPDGT